MLPRRTLRLALFATLALLAIPGAAHATDLTWTGATSTDTMVASNWAPAQVPANGDRLIVPGGTANAPSFATTLNLTELRVAGPVTIVTGTLDITTLHLTAGAAVTQTDGQVTAGVVTSAAGTKSYAHRNGGLTTTGVADFGSTAFTLGGGGGGTTPQLSPGDSFSAATFSYLNGILFLAGGTGVFTNTRFDVPNGTATSVAGAMTLGAGSEIDVQSGQMLFNYDVTLDGGTLRTRLGAVIEQYDDPMWTQGVVRVQSGPIVTAGGTARIVNSIVQVNAATSVAAAATLELQASLLALDADLGLAAGAKVNLLGASSFAAVNTARTVSGGTVTWSGDADLNIGAVGLRFTSGAVLEVTAEGAADFGNHPLTIGTNATLRSVVGKSTVLVGGGTVTISASGRILAPATSRLEITNLANLPGSTLGDGTYETLGDGRIVLPAAVETITEDTHVILGDDNGLRTGLNGASNALAGLAEIDADGSLETKPGAVANIGENVSVRGRLIADGTVTMAGPGKTLHIEENGRVGGSGTIEGEIQAPEGTLVANGLHLNGNLNAGADLTTQVQIAAQSAPALTATGYLGIDGTLDVDTTGYTLDYTDSYELMSATNVLGSFDAVSPLGGNAVARLTKNAGGNALTLDVTETVAPNVVPAVQLIGSALTKDTRPIVSFTAGSDADSGIDASRFSVEFSQSPTTLPDTTPDTVSALTAQPAGPLADGTWYAHVRNVDLEGNWGAVAGHSVAFTVDTTAPAAPGIGGTPAARTEARSVTFTLVPDTGATLQCSLDAAAFTACSGSATFTNLALGAHTFSARGVDAAGNVGTTTTVSWTIVAPAAKPVPKGTAKADKITGSALRDVINGLAGNDILRGLGGNDTIKGGAGNDKVDGGVGNDALDGGTGKDTITGGPGNDTIIARDKARDVISCGAGKDKVVADKIDKVAKDCEKVIRK